MSFSEGLKRIAEKIDDLLGVALVDTEGLLIEEYKADPSFDLLSLVAEYSAFVKAADKASLSMDLGPSSEVTILTDTMAIIIKKINEGYFLFLAAESDKNIGKGRFFMKREAWNLAADL